MGMHGVDGVEDADPQETDSLLDSHAGQHKPAANPLGAPLGDSDPSGDADPTGRSLVQDAVLVLVPLAYAFFFGAISGIVSPIDSAYGHRFMALLSVAYTAPGLPCALLQMKWDLDFDERFSSPITFQVRMSIFFLMIITCLIALTIEQSRSALLVANCMAGFATWFAHGTFTQAALMLAPHVTKLKQLGFPLAGLLSLGLMFATQVNNASLHGSLITWWFFIAMVITATGWLAWLCYMWCSTFATQRLALRDHRLFSSTRLSNTDRDDSFSQGSQTIEDTKLNTSGEQELECIRHKHDIDLMKLAAACSMTIASSNLMGSLFAYIESDGTMQLLTALTYARLFSDAAARFTTYVWRPQFAYSANGLLWTAIIRTASVSLFFLYEAKVLPQSDWAVLLYVILANFLSGLLGTWVYVVAQEQCDHLSDTHHEEALAHSSFVLNMSVHVAAFTVAPVSVALAFLMDSK